MIQIISFIEGIKLFKPACVLKPNSWLGARRLNNLIRKYIHTSFITYRSLHVASQKEPGCRKRACLPPRPEFTLKTKTSGGFGLRPTAFGRAAPRYEGSHAQTSLWTLIQI